jgi:diguanylate cyclase (GGDEF)-like protein
MFQSQPLIVLPALGAVVSFVNGVLSWRRRHLSRAALPLTAVMIGVTEWSAVEAVSASMSNVHAALAWQLAIFPGVGLAVLSFLWICRLLTNSDAVVTRRTVLLLSIEPVLVTVAAATNFVHHALFSGAVLRGHPALLFTDKGPIYWVHTAYSYALLGYCFIALLRGWRAASGVHRRQLGVVLLAALTPTIFNVVEVFVLRANAQIDVTVLGFTATGGLVGWAIFANAMLRTTVARDVVFQRVSDAVIVVDPDGLLLDYNLAAERLAAGVWPEFAGRLTGARLDQLMPAAVAMMDPGYGDGESRISVQGRILDVHSAPLTRRGGECIGFAMVLRDITDIVVANARLTEQLAVNERLTAELAERAVRDVLTGLFNRRHLMETLDAQLKYAARHGESVAVVLLDVDFFKSVNDRFGHGIGDEVLAGVAAVLQAGAREGDTVARYGGEEFVVVMPGVDAESAVRRADELRRRCAELTVHSEMGEVNTTLSAGVATYPSSGETGAELLQAADLALYRAKDAGRDRVLLALPPTDNEPIPITLTEITDTEITPTELRAAG